MRPATFWPRKLSMLEMTVTDNRLFLSRAGADSGAAVTIAAILEKDGYNVTVQDWDFANSSFMQKMHDALDSGARVIALLSPEYLRSDYCAAEWQAAIARDPLNRRHRLILLRVAECVPGGLLAPLWYWDLVKVLPNHDLLSHVVRNAVREGHLQQRAAAAGPYWRAAVAIVDPNAVLETTSFTGRALDLGFIDKHFSPNTGATLVLHGLGGVGKSSLAREYARRNIDRYSIIWRVTANAEHALIDSIAALGAQINPGLTDVKDLAKAAEHVVAELLPSLDRRTLLIFDNLEDEELLHRWSPSGADILVTTRNSTWSSDVVTLPVRSLARDDSIQYLKNNSARRDLTNLHAAAIAQELGDLPLALAQASAYLRTTRTVTAASYLQRIKIHLQRLPKHIRFERSTYATFTEAIAQIDASQPGAGALMCLASCFAPTAIPKALLGTPQPRVVAELAPVLNGDYLAALSSVQHNQLALEEALAALDRLSLIEYNVVDETFDVHVLVQSAARDVLCGETGTWAIGAVVAANRAFPAPHFENWNVCEKLLPHAMAALAVLPTHLAFDAAGRLCNQSAYYLEERALYPAAERLYRRSLDIALATEASGGKPALALNNLAWLVSRRGNNVLAEAMLRRALHLVEQSASTSPTELLPILNNLAVILRESGRADEATRIHERISRLTTQSEMTAGTTIRINKARLLIESGNLEEAEAILRTALETDRGKHGQRHPSVALAIENLGDLELVRGRHAESEQLFLEALDILEECFGQDHPQVALCLARMGVVVAITRPDEAGSIYLRAAAILERHGAINAETLVALYNNLAALYMSQGKYAMADQSFARSLAVLAGRRMHESVDCGAIFANRAANFIASGSLGQAEGALRSSLMIFEKADAEHPDLVHVLRMLASVLEMTDRSDEVPGLLRRARLIEAKPRN